MAPYEEDVNTPKRIIPMITLDNVCEEKKLKGPYVLKVDVQGAELLVLEGAVKVLENCDLVILEVSFFNFRKDTPDLFEVVQYMKNQGFPLLFSLCSCNQL